MKTTDNMQEKLFQGGNILATITATVGTYVSDFWPIALGVAGWAVNIALKWRKEQQEYRHREELHQIELRRQKK